jgi:hypothetical protein
MARRAALLTLALTVACAPVAGLHAQNGGVQSNLPEAGFGPPAAAAPSTAAAPSAPAASSTAAGTALPGGSPTTTIHVFSRETIVDVIATDDKGNPVRGLTRSDFTILEDKHPQPIRGFSESSTSLPPPPGGGRPPPPPPTHTPPPPPPRHLH